MTATASGTQAVWAFAEHEHRDLARGINRIHDVACEIGRRATPDISVHVLDVLQWIDLTLEPHIAWEESWLYPEIDRRTGTQWATRAARFDHVQVRETAGRLHADESALIHDLGGDLQAELRCHLFGLEALLRAHIEREERFLIPLLDDDSSLVDDELPQPAARFG
ncbi:MAG TPA: hemerythrin domain-containing protein [Candidatus Limnocylindrales bacterium]|nr:hemerythrin domain-containing protein [Candidatus Limnocylindrales bacterium]